MPHILRAHAAPLPRRLAALLLVTLLLALPCLPARPALAAPPIPEDSPVNAASVILYDMQDGTVLLESHPDTSIAPASLTKVMTMAVTMDLVQEGRLTLDDLVTVSDKALAQGGAYMGIQLGEQVPLKELLLGMAVASGNDAAMAVAEHVGGGDAEVFIGMMNEKARALGMERTTFVNPHGMPAKLQRTTARDMLLLARDYMTRHPEMLALHNTHFLMHGQRLTWNHNPLLGNYEGADGLKTGWIKKSGYNIIATAQRDGRRLVVVMLGGGDPSARYQECCRLFDAGFGAERTPEAVAALLPTIPAASYPPDLRLTKREAFARYGIRPKYVKRGNKAAKAARDKAAGRKGDKGRSASRKSAGKRASQKPAAQGKQPSSGRQPAAGTSAGKERARGTSAGKGARNEPAPAQKQPSQSSRSEPRT